MKLDEPWRALPPRLGELIRPHVAALSDEVIAEIRERVPDYRRPLRGRFGVGIRSGVEQALDQFVDLISEPETDRSDRDEIYRALGRGEHRERRSLDALLSAYRLGARVSWRRVSRLAIDARVDRETLALLAEAVFAYIDELSALSAEGYAQEQSAEAGQRQRLRRRVAALLLVADPDPDAIAAAAAAAGWALPETVAALAWTGRRLTTRLPADALPVEDSEGGGLALLADPGAPGLRSRLERAAGASVAVLGPTVALSEAAASVARVRAADRLVARGALASDGLIVADEHLGVLVAHGDEDALAELTRSRLEPLGAETPASRRRLGDTLRAWIDHQGEVGRVAAVINVHPQTVRYRLRRLRELFGPALEDPEARFELALALRGAVSFAERPGNS